MIRLLLAFSLFSGSLLAADKLTVESGPNQLSVVELYTSEGCSSCPPADQWLEALIQIPEDQEKVLALAFHVDYWDYIGWKDRFASPENTNRQRLLGANNQQRSIYTPEFFVDGKEIRGTGNVISSIQQRNKNLSPVKLILSVSKLDNHLNIELQTESSHDASNSLHHRYIVYENKLSSEVKRGENSGKLLTHQQVVRYMSPAIRMKDFDQYRIKINSDWQLQNIGIAALVTTAGSDSYIQAVHTPIASLIQ